MVQMQQRLESYENDSANFYKKNNEFDSKM